MQDAWRAYMELALGLTEASKKKATNVAKRLIGKGGATAEQLQALAEDLVRTSTANREAMTKLVRYELDRALGVVGLATAEEVADLTARVRDLEQQLRETEARVATAEVPAAAPATKAPARTASTTGPANKALAKKAMAKKAGAKRTAAGTTVAKKTVAKKTVAKKAGRGTATGTAGS